MRSQVITLVALLGCGLAQAGDLSLTNCGPIGLGYGIAPYLRVAEALQNMGQTNAIRKLGEWAEGGGQDGQVIILCRMLFEKAEGREFRRPMIGGASFLGGTSYSDWPLEPIALQTGVPILITEGYMLAGLAEPSFAYLDYCLKNCRWSSVRYAEISADRRLKAIQDLIRTTQWKRRLTAVEKDFLVQQAEPRLEPHR